MVDLDRITTRLTILADEWHEAAAGQPLSDISVNLWDIMCDFGKVLGLDPSEIAVILNPKV
jgi:hypothetical protein